MRHQRVQERAEKIPSDMQSKVVKVILDGQWEVIRLAEQSSHGTSPNRTEQPRLL